jgi:MFS superfamily sulfate permease-like transporter
MTDTSDKNRECVGPSVVNFITGFLCAMGGLRDDGTVG